MMESCWSRLKLHGKIRDELGDVGHILVANQVEDEMVSIFRGQFAESAGGIKLELVEDRFVALQRVGSRKELHLLDGLLRLGAGFDPVEVHIRWGCLRSQRDVSRYFKLDLSEASSLNIGDLLHKTLMLWNIWL